jgi:pimeloyl-ACP methyl ester carboxylesterase
MSSDTITRVKDKFVTVDGLNTRYIEEGAGHPVLLLHGASLGSSADVFIRNLAPLARAGLRAIAFDQPGFGLTDAPQDHAPAYRRDFIPKFMDALGLKSAALVGHSQAGNPAVQLALKEPARYSHVIVLGTGSLLPPLDGAGDSARDNEGAAQQRLERRMAAEEPTIEDTRKLLEANLFHHELITPDELALRHSRSIGAAFEAFVARSAQAEAAPVKEPKTPMWQRLAEVSQPLLLIFGREDRQPSETKASATRCPHRRRLQASRPLGRRRRIPPPSSAGPPQMTAMCADLTGQRSNPPPPCGEVGASHRAISAMARRVGGYSPPRHTQGDS